MTSNNDASQWIFWKGPYGNYETVNSSPEGENLKFFSKPMNEISNLSL